MTDTPNVELPLCLRLAEDADKALLYDSWIRSMKATYVPLGKKGDVRRFCDRVRARVAAVWESGIIYIACNPDDRTQIYGWCAVQRTDAGPILHYVYVKRPYRRLGVCHRLLAGARWEPGAASMTSCRSDMFEECYAGRFANTELGAP